MYILGRTITDTNTNTNTNTNTKRNNNDNNNNTNNNNDNDDNNNNNDNDENTRPWLEVSPSYQCAFNEYASVSRRQSSRSHRSQSAVLPLPPAQLT